MSPTFPLGFSFDDEAEAPTVPTVTNPFPSGFKFDDSQAIFPSDGIERPLTTLDKIARNITPWAIANNLIIEPTLVTGNTLGGIPDAYNELRAGKTPHNKFIAGVGAPFQSLLNAITRNELPENKLAAQARTISSMVGAAEGSLAGLPLGPLTTILGGITGSVAGDRNAREKLQARGEMPQGNQSDENSDDAAAFGTGLLYGKGSNFSKQKIAKGAGGREVTASKLIENIDRGTRPASLQAQALGGVPQDFVMRPPRTGAPDPLHITPRNTVDVIATDALQNPSDVVKKLTSDYEATLLLDEPDQLLLESNNSPAVINQLDNLFDPESLPTTNNQPNVAGNTTSTVVEANATLPRRGERDPNSYYLDQALDEPGMQDVMSYRRTGEGSEFDTLTPHSVGRQIQAKNRNREILSAIPEEQWPTVGDVLFRDFDQSLNSANVPQFRKRPMYDVLYDEISGLTPRILGWLDDDRRAKEFKGLIAKQRLSERGGARSVNDGQTHHGLTAPEQERLNGYLEQIQSARLSPTLMDELKTHFDSGANFEKKHKGTIDPKTNRSDGYELIGNNLRNSLESLVNQAAPEQFDAFRQNNRQIQVLHRVEDLSKARGAEESQFGRDRKLDNIKRAPNGVIGLFGDAAQKLKRVFVPEPQSREAKLRAGDRDPFNKGTGVGAISLPGVTSGLARIDRAINRGIGGYEDLTTSQIRATPNRPVQIGTEGLQAGGIAARENREETENRGLDPIDKAVGNFGDNISNAAKSIGGFFQRNNPFSVQEAGAEELPQKLPRNSQDFSSDQLANFLMQTINSPQAPIAQQLVGKLKQAVQAQDIDKVERLHADMVKIFPELFEQGTGVNGKVFYPDEQIKIMENLRQLHRQGQIDSIHLAKQRNAFMNPMDSRILPVERKPQTAYSGPNQIVNGTRQYAY